MVMEIASGRRSSRPRRRRGPRGGWAPLLGVAVVMALIAFRILPEDMLDSVLDEAGAGGGTLVVGGVTVTDGDTIRIAGERIRIENIDTPELGDGAECLAERRLADMAHSAAAAMFAEGGEVRVARSGEDQYGRTLARVSVGGRDFGRAMISAGYAEPWTGRRVDWCR